MLGRQVLALGGGVRRGVVWALPSWAAVRRLTRRLLTVGLSLAILAAIVRVGGAAGLPHPGYAAVGFGCLVLAALVPLAYLGVAFATATGSLLGRRAVALGRAVAAVRRHRAARRDRHGRPR